MGRDPGRGVVERAVGGRGGRPWPAREVRTRGRFPAHNPHEATLPGCTGEDSTTQPGSPTRSPALRLPNRRPRGHGEATEGLSHAGTRWRGGDTVPVVTSSAAAAPCLPCGRSSQSSRRVGGRGPHPQAHAGACMRARTWGFRPLRVCASIASSCLAACHHHHHHLPGSVHSRATRGLLS